MLTKEVSQNYFRNSLTSIHSTRANSLFEACWALTQQAELTISSLGQHKDGKAHVKNKIKSVDRLVGNPRLFAEIHTVYREFYYPFLVSLPCLSIIVDWSGCCCNDTHMLRASVVHDGRSITIYNEIHPQNMLGNPDVQRKFLLALKRLLPLGKRTIIITDAGFVTPWFHAVLKMGWDYIGRLKGDTKALYSDNSRWIKTSTLYKKANNKIKYIGKGLIGSSSRTPVEGHVYSYREKKKNRKGKSRYPDVNKRYSKANTIPWIIVTSLNNNSFGKDYIKSAYEKRMQIEQTFRDDKSPRFGFGWRHGRNECSKRIAILCLIASIAAFLLISIGMVAEKLNLHVRYQVNTLKCRVLSFLTLAKLILRHEIPSELNKAYAKLTRQLIRNSKVLYLC